MTPKTLDKACFIPYLCSKRTNEMRTKRRRSTKPSPSIEAFFYLWNKHYYKPKFLTIMFLNKITYQSKLTVVEVGSFMTEFYRIFCLPIDEPAETDKDLLSDDICLTKKGDFFGTELEAFTKGIKRIRKMDQTEPMTELNKRRKKQFSGIISYICGWETDSDATKAAAAQTLQVVVEEFKGISKLTNSGLGMHITRFIETLRDEKYAAEYTALQLEDRLNELEQTNAQYTTLASERASEQENIPESPSKMRLKCIHCYYELVDLMNFALKNNKYYLYEEKAMQLEGITQKAQELINRRRNLAEKEKEETPENEAATEETSETPEEGVA